MVDPTILVAFGAGLISFFAPCVFPLVPGFLAYLGGVVLDKDGAESARISALGASVLFVVGFITVFAIMGLLLHSTLVRVGVSFQTTMAQIGGAIMIFFGLYIMGLVKLSFFDRPHLFLIHKKFSSRKITAFVFGAAFAAGWTPCVGVALGAIFGLAIIEPAKTFFLLTSYAFGLGVPFLMMGFFTEFFAGRVEEYTKKSLVWVQYVNILFGGVLILLGGLAFTQNLAVCRAVLWKFPF